MKRTAAMLIALAMLFAVGCQPPADGGGGGGDASGSSDENTTMTAPVIDGEGVQMVSIKLPGMS